MSLDLDSSVITKVTDPDALQQMWDMGMRADLIVDPAKRSIYQFSVDYWLDSGMKDAPTEGVILHEYPSTDLTPSSETVRWIVESLQHRFAANRAQEVIRAGAEVVNEDPREALSALFSLSAAAVETLSPRISRADMATNVTERRKRYSERQEHGVRGLTFGFPEVDEHTNGILPGELAAVAGTAKTGKTFFLGNAAIQALREGHKPLIITLEQSVEEIEDRLDAIFSGLSGDKIRRAELDPEETRQLMAAQDEMASLGSLHVERPPVGERTSAHLANRARQLGCDYLIVDQLSFMEARHRFDDVRETHSSIIFDLKNEISRDEAGKLPCLIAVQFNREAAKSGGGLHNFANTADIERTVDFALGLDRRKEVRANNSMEMSIMGARRGDTGKWLLEWNLGKRTRFSVRHKVEEEE